MPAFSREQSGLSGDWLLEDLAGSGVLDSVQATLSFPQVGKAAGNSSCNRYSGSVAINGDSIRFGPLVGTRMACLEAVMNQEKKYLAALAAAERYRLEDAQLLIFCKGLDKPLRFAPKTQESTQSALASGNAVERLPGHIWRVENGDPPQPARGSIFIFFANGMLLETSCTETYRIATWKAKDGQPADLEVSEDGQPAFTATIAEDSGGTLRLRQKLTRTGEIRDLTLHAVREEFVCPDLR